MLEAWVFGITIVGGAVLFSTLGVLLVRRRMSQGTFRGHHEVAGYLLSIVGTLYSVLLGLIVVDTQGKYQQAKAMARQEADSCLDMFHLAYALPLDTRRKLHLAVMEYLRVLVEDEWDSISDKDAFRESGAVPFRNIWWLLVDFDPKSNKEQIAYDKTLDIMQQLADGRRYRLQVSKGGLPQVLWGVLIAGGSLTVIFTYLFEVESASTQIVMTVIVSLSLSLNVLLVAFFNNPYKGYMRITSYAFAYDLRVTQELLKIRPD